MGQHRTWAKWTALVAAPLIAGVLVAGCSGSSDSAAVAATSAGAWADSDSGSVDETAPSDDAGFAYNDSESWDAEMPAADMADSDVSASSGAATGESGSSGDPGDIGLTDRQIIRTADVTVTVEVEPADGERRADDAELTAAANRAAVKVRALARIPGAYISGSEGYGSTVTVTMRIPAGSYDQVMDRLSDIGTVTGRSEYTSDVTGEMVDVTSRIKTMQSSVDRLRALMTEADTMADVISLESELSRREADLEALQRRQATLSDQVALSTISVTVEAVTADTEPEPTPEQSAFMKGLHAGWDGVAGFGRGAAAVGGALLPWLPILAVAALIVLWAVRRRRGASLAAMATPLPAGVAAGQPLQGGADVNQVDQDADDGGEPQ